MSKIPSQHKEALTSIPSTMITTIAPPVGKDVTNISKVTKGKEIMDAQVQPEGHNKTVSLEEIQEFLKLIKKSNFKIVDQLRKMPSKISILSLLLSSKAHRTPLVKVMDAAHIMHDITVDQLDKVITNITTIRYLEFNDAEFSAEGTAHNKSLHIFVTCMDTLLFGVLVATSSSLNVMPQNTLS